MKKDTSVRLNRFIAMCGVCSRRKADNLIQQGLISINTNIVSGLGCKVYPTDVVCLNGRRILPEKKQYILLNKPKGYITTMSDEKGRRTVVSLIEKACKERLVPVGRLDKETTGLLLFTNDGLLAKRLMHPKHKIKKIYHVKLNEKVKKIDVLKMKKGIILDDGFMKIDNAQYINNSQLEVKVEIHVGKNRIVRRIFESLGYGPIQLDRIQYSFLTKKHLSIGQWRMLTPKEIKNLNRDT